MCIAQHPTLVNFLSTLIFLDEHTETSWACCEPILAIEDRIHLWNSELQPNHHSITPNEQFKYRASELRNKLG